VCVLAVGKEQSVQDGAPDGYCLGECVGKV